MSKLPSLTGRALIKVLTKAGFSVTRVKGSHHFLQHRDGRRTTVPVHTGEHIGPGLMMKILRDLEMTREELEELR